MSLNGLKALVTAGPTYEPIDPVRFIGNRSSGKQGYAIAEALANAGAEVTLISGPTNLPAPNPENKNTMPSPPSESENTSPPTGLPTDPPTNPPTNPLTGLHYVKYIEIETAEEMLRACEDTIQNRAPDIAICAAAVSDWAPTTFEDHKIKKRAGEDTLTLTLKKNPDILRTIARHKSRPRLVIGFAAETQDLLDNAREKLGSKGCDWILANDVDGGKTFGADENHVYLLSKDNTEEWPKMNKQDIAETLARKIEEFFESEA